MHLHTFIYVQKYVYILYAVFKTWINVLFLSVIFCLFLKSGFCLSSESTWISGNTFYNINKTRQLEVSSNFDGTRPDIIQTSIFILYTSKPGFKGNQVKRKWQNASSFYERIQNVRFWFYPLSFFFLQTHFCLFFCEDFIHSLGLDNHWKTPAAFFCLKLPPLFGETHTAAKQTWLGSPSPFCGHRENWLRHPAVPPKMMWSWDSLTFCLLIYKMLTVTMPALQLCWILTIWKTTIIRKVLKRHQLYFCYSCLYFSLEIVSYVGANNIL